MPPGEQQTSALPLIYSPGDLGRQRVSAFQGAIPARMIYSLIFSSAFLFFMQLDIHFHDSGTSRPLVRLDT